MSRALPGMPLAIGDPGVFVCRIDDGAPGTPGPHRAATTRPIPDALHGQWLVSTLCPHCTGWRYCHDHHAGNWWLENFRPRG